MKRRCRSGQRCLRRRAGQARIIPQTPNIKPETPNTKLQIQPSNPKPKTTQTIPHNLKPKTPKTKPNTLHSQPSSLNPRPYDFKPGPYTLHPNPQNLQPQTLNPKTQHSNPQPGTPCTELQLSCDDDSTCPTTALSSATLAWRAAGRTLAFLVHVRFQRRLFSMCCRLVFLIGSG